MAEMERTPCCDKYIQPLFHAIVAFLKKWDSVKEAKVNNDISIRNNGVQSFLDSSI